MTSHRHDRGTALHAALGAPKLLLVISAGPLLITPWDRLARVGSHHHPWLPVKVSMPRAGGSRHRSAEGLTHQQQWSAVLAMRERDRLLVIAHQARFAEPAAARAVAGILREDHAQAQWRQRVRVERAMADMPGVAVKDVDRLDPEVCATCTRRNFRQCGEPPKE